MRQEVLEAPNMDVLGRDKLFATEWVERTFDYVRTARTVLRDDGELVFILTWEERSIDPKKDLADLIAISESLTVYDSNLYVDAFYFIYQVKGEITHKIGYIDTADLLAYSQKLVTLKDIMDRLVYTSVFDSPEKRNETWS